MSIREARRAAVALAATTALAAAAPAHAGPLVESAPGCESGSTTQRFAPWMDFARYFLAPDGAFDQGGDGWTLDGAGADGVLSLDDGALAISPTICVGVEHPAIRFFVRQTGGHPLGHVRVGAYVEDRAGLIDYVPMGGVPAASRMHPSAPVVLSASLLALLPGRHTPIRLRFEGVGGSFEVDELWIDPYGGH